MPFVQHILEKMVDLKKPQKKFMVTLFSTILLMRGKVNFRNMSRYSELCEKTFSRQFRKSFDFATFNQLLIEDVIEPKHEKVAVMDCSYIPKSGKKTYGLDFFFDSSHKKPAKGLEISNLSVINIDNKIAYNLSSLQTPSMEEIKQTQKENVSRKDAEETRIDFYLKHLNQNRSHLPQDVRYLLVDGFYAKCKFVDGTLAMNLDIIGKLRCDANLRFLYDGSQKPKGRHRHYDGKVRFDDLNRLNYLCHIEEHIHLYTSVVNSISLKRNIRIVYVLNLKDKKKPKYVILFSTDIQLSAKKIYLYYKARFQIEFIFRDSKQFTGLADCQARSKESLHFHFNASLTAVNLAKVDAVDKFAKDASEPFSLATQKIVYFNEHLLTQFISILGLDLTSIKNNPYYEKLRTYGAIAA